MSGTFYIPIPGDDSEAARAYDLLLLGLQPEGPAHFSPDGRGNFASAWELWLKNGFGPLVAPSFVDAYMHASRFEITEIFEIDRHLSAGLTPSAAIRSSEAAKPFFAAKDRMQHHREWKKFEEAVVSGKSPGTFAVTAAVQAALFRVPLLPALVSYVKFEFRNAAEFSGFHLQEPESLFFDAAIEQAKVALKRKFRDTPFPEAEDSGGLKAI